MKRRRRRRRRRRTRRNKKKEERRSRRRRRRRRIRKVRKRGLNDFLEKSGDPRGDRQDKVFVDLGPLYTNLKGEGVLKSICVCFLQSNGNKENDVIGCNFSVE